MPGLPVKTPTTGTTLGTIQKVCGVFGGQSGFCAMQVVTAAQDHLRALHGRLRQLIAKGGELRDKQRACSKEFDVLDNIQSSDLKQLADSEVSCVTLDHDSCVQARKLETMKSRLKRLQQIANQVSVEDAKRRYHLQLWDYVGLSFMVERAEFGKYKDSLLSLPDSYYTQDMLVTIFNWNFQND